MIHQELQHVPELTVAQNMFLGHPLKAVGGLLVARRRQEAAAAAAVLRELARAEGWPAAVGMRGTSGRTAVMEAVFWRLAESVGGLVAGGARFQGPGDLHRAVRG